MKTFFNLIQEVQKPGLCHRCGGCVTFCNAVNFGALDLDEDGVPRYAEIEKCIECGLCYAICPEIAELEEETRRLVSWSAPVGRVMETHVARAGHSEIRDRGTDGGVVTALLMHLMDTGRIDGAVVTRPIDMFQREPILAQDKEDILESAGFYADTSPGMKNFSDRYLTYTTVEELGPVMRRGLRRVAFVGTPCQIKAIRKMQAMRIVPSESIAFCLGLFCSGNFVFGDRQKEKLAELGGFSWDDVRKINIKDALQVHLTGGDIRTIPLNQLDFMRREACRFCPDYASEYADLSFGGLGAGEGWTTVLARTPMGRAALTEAMESSAVEKGDRREGHSPSQAFEQILDWSRRKKQLAEESRSQLGKPSVRFRTT